MKRFPHLLVAAIVAIALGGCAMLVQVDESDVETYAAFQPFGFADELLADLP